MPRAGDTFLGFHLVEELGRGTFARVFLARQGDLADRPVVLKVSVGPRAESHTLAQLQHTNIVPIFSVHRSDDFHVLCMPYLGSVTLADIYRSLTGMPSLPVSGRGLVSTLTARRGTTYLTRAGSAYTQPTVGVGSRGMRGPSSPEIRLDAGELQANAPAASLPDRGDVFATLKVLEGLSYVEAVLWLGARLADGLAHAHDRGIVHRDLKPANVLLTDEGQPMLLDFNLSEDANRPDGGSGIGGTLPYMAPEQLEAFRQGRRHVDPRSDLYALGVILYELLTRRHPFPPYGRVTPDVLAAMVQDRLRPPPCSRTYNRAVSPAVKSIVRHCLEPDPQRRYESARQLKEDLERHLANEPLRYAPDPSPMERLGKWRRRHPFLSSSTAVGAAGAAIFVALTVALVWRGERLNRLQAESGLRDIGAQVHVAQALLFDRNAGSERREEGLRICRTALDRHEVLRNPAWLTGPTARSLSADERGQLADHVGDLLFLLANATRQQAGSAFAGRTDDQLSQAMELNDLAVASYEPRGVPRAVWQQRADLARLLRRPDEERQSVQKAAATAPRPDKDAFLTAYLSYTEGKYRAALPLLRQATQEVPQSFVAWFARGLCHYELLQDAEAVACFNSCVALRPDFSWTWYNRGLAHRRLRHFEQARDDFDKAIALQPGNAQGCINRALAKEGLKDYDGAVSDLTHALELAEGHNASLTAVYFLRAAARAKAKDIAGARLDREEGMRRQPTDEDGFIERGLARVGGDPKGALDDFEAALKINPVSFRGLQNKAAILVDKFGREEEALRVEDRAVQLYPDSALALAGRGVLQARAGRQEPARADARAALLVDASPSSFYQAACIFALTSRQDAADRAEACQLLSAALRGGFGLDLVDDDTDLAPLRGLPEYRRLVEAARALARPARGAGAGQIGTLSSVSGSR